MRSSPDECAHEILDVIPLVMRAIRAEFRRHRGNDLSVPQFRSLLFINRNPGTSLIMLAEHLGLTSPSTSTLVDGLVGRQLIVRQLSEADRRRITLMLTQTGKELLESSHRATLVSFADLFAKLSESDRSDILGAMQLLRPIFAGDETLEVATQGETYADSGN